MRSIKGNLHSFLIVKNSRVILFQVLGAFIFLCFTCLTTTATERPQITITVLTPGEVRIEARWETPSSSWSFRNAYAGILGLADRIEDFRATTPSAQDAAAKKIVVGEFTSGSPANKVSYTVNISKPNAADVSHASWMTRDYGLLMLADLLPRDFTSVSLELLLPGNWGVTGSSLRNGNLAQVDEPEKAVFFIGRLFRKAQGSVDGVPVTTVLGGDWPFSERDAQAAAMRVLKSYLELTRFKLSGAFVIIAPLPVRVGDTKWRAETRGSTVVLLIDPAANFKNWVGQLGVIFTHELLHLWVPNRLQLEGDYDWFFEGFTLYTALQTALRLKIINFKEYLDTLARVYDSYLSYADELSLSDASERRWTTPGTLVYDKGMLVAFLYDLKVRKETGGKVTLADRYRELFRGRPAANADANDAIIALLDSPPSMSGFSESFVRRSAKVELEQILSSYGLTIDASGSQSQLQVNRALNAEQKQLLRSLGYRK